VVGRRGDGDAGDGGAAAVSVILSMSVGYCKRCADGA